MPLPLIVTVAWSRPVAGRMLPGLMMPTESVAVPEVLVGVTCTQGWSLRRRPVRGARRRPW